MSGKFLMEPWSNRNKARLEELRVANGDHLFSQIDILQGSAQHLADPHTSPVEEQNECPVHRRHLRAVPDAQRFRGV